MPRVRSAVVLEGSDAGVSFRTLHDPAARLTYTVVSNTMSGCRSNAVSSSVGIRSREISR